MNYSYIYVNTHTKLFQSQKQFEWKTKFIDHIQNEIIFIKFKTKQAILLFRDTYIGSQNQTKHKQPPTHTHPETAKSKDMQKNDQADLEAWGEDGRAGRWQGERAQR